MCRAGMSCLLFSVILPAGVGAGEWPQFRGPRGDGTTPETAAPLRWSATRNVRWKIRLPRPGNGSPIVANGSVFLACAEDAEGKRRSLYCFDRRTGARRWVRTVDFGRVMPTHKTNPYCATTPATDGQRVVVWHGTAGLFCYDRDGALLWSRDLGEFAHIWGYATSPILHGDRVILHTGPGRQPFVAAFDLRTGEERWRTEEPVDFVDASRNRDGKYEGSWATPVLAGIGGRVAAICTMPTRVVAYDVDTGERLWWCRGIRGQRGDLAYSSPIIGDGLCVAVGGYGGPAIGFRLGGRGDVTGTHRLWRLEKNPQSIGTGVFHNGFVYRVNADRPAPVECLDPRTGKIVWRADRRGGVCWGSLIAVGDVGYVTNRQGTTMVFRLDPEKYVELSRNELGEPCHATPAVSNGELFLRTWRHLYCIADPAS